MSILASMRREIFARLWSIYRQAVPQVSAVEDILRAEGQAWIEDHVALRTLPGPHCGAHILQGLFESLGYRRQEDLFFAQKQLKAFWMAPPLEDENHTISPKIFISELVPDQFSPLFQQTLLHYTQPLVGNPLAQLNAVEPDQQVETILAYLSGRPWQRPHYLDYQVLLKESEYAAWTLAFGHQVNHFTLSVHLMSRFPTLAAFNTFIIEQLQIPMNVSGGLIKGSAACGLEQSATLAAGLPVMFQEGLYTLPYAFVEFAYRHPLPGQQADGQWSSYYQGFVVSNADRIFESTHASDPVILLSGHSAQKK